MSFGQILQWTKTITAPEPGVTITGLNVTSKNAVSSGCVVVWTKNWYKSQQIFWFGVRGAVIYSEIIKEETEQITPYGITINRLVTRKWMGEGYRFTTFTRKGSIVEKAIIDANVIQNEQQQPRDEAGFFAVEKGAGDTWILKRYIY